jgi:hypothetical protein
MAFAYLAEDKIYLKDGDAPVKLIESPFAQAVVDRDVRSRQRSDWKTKGAGAAFQGGVMPWARQADDPSARQAKMSAVTGGNNGELVYALNTAAVGGLFVYEIVTSSERRIFHKNGLRIRGLTRRPADGLLALSLHLEDGTANIATIDTNGRGLREVTEGDSVDESPAWLAGERRRLLFQSAGVGRGAQGHVAGLGPYAMQQLDLENGELTTLLEKDDTDYLCPKPMPDGTIYCIRRPYRPGHATAINPVKLAVDILLFPLRLAGAIVHFFNFFSMMFSGKPLLTAGGANAKPVDQKHLMLWGKFIDADKALKAAKQGESPSLVPPDWELIRRTADGREETLVKGVLAFDVHPDGRVLYTNGSAVFQLAADGSSQKLCDGKMIEHVVVV